MRESTTQSRNTTTTPPRDGTGASQLEAWSFRAIRRDYWRVVAVGMLAMLIAYLGSFIIAPTYAATARVLIRGRDSTILNSDGSNLDAQPGVIDSQLAAALSDTQAALVSNRHVAEIVVERLGLDAPKPEKNGPVAKLKRGLASAYKHARGYLTAGFYKDPGRRETAVQNVAQGLSAKQVHSGFALDITGTWDEPQAAADIANTAADVLARESNERFRTESATYRDYLRQQVDAALTTEQDARAKLADYKSQHGIVDTPQSDAQISVASADQLRSEISAAQAELDANRAQVASLDSQLASTPQFVDTTQHITTGRSSTSVTNTGPNPVYQTLLSQRQQAQAAVASVSARLGALRGALGTATDDPGAISRQQRDIDKLSLDLTIASETRKRLAEQLEIASVNAQSPQVELTRVATAAAPTYPIAPKRYLFLAVGLFLGALIGFVWSFFRVQRRTPEFVPADGNGAAGRDLDQLGAVDLGAAERTERVGAPGSGARERS